MPDSDAMSSFQGLGGDLKVSTCPPPLPPRACSPLSSLHEASRPGMVLALAGRSKMLLHAIGVSRIHPPGKHAHIATGHKRVIDVDSRAFFCTETQSTYGMLSRYAVYICGHLADIVSPVTVSLSLISSHSCAGVFDLEPCRSKSTVRQVVHLATEWSPSS